MPAAMKQLQDTWRANFPDLPYNPELLDDMLVTQYDAEQRWQQVTLTASIIAIIIACMGLFGQVTLTIARRTKEIGIRKVLGASVGNVAMLLSARLLTRILIAGVISCAAAYYVMSRWLEQFPYRIELGIESFVIAIGLALLIALTTAGIRTIRAATANPTESLRYE
jgi:putative ABC transport system permease protein